MDYDLNGYNEDDLEWVEIDPETWMLVMERVGGSERAAHSFIRHALYDELWFKVFELGDPEMLALAEAMPDPW
jgi:hypothetical protein